MEFALLLSALALGLAGVPHCAAMCAAPCAALTGRGNTGPVAWTFHAARVLSYTLAGAVVAGSVGALAALAQWSPVLRPLWTLLHASAFVLGLWMLWQGRQPVWLESLGRGSARAAGPAAGWKRLRGPIKAGAAGLAWAAWPCGLLQSAILVAALANTPASGAVTMLVFALATGLGLSAAPWLWRRLGAHPTALLSGTAGVRLAGLMLAAAAFFAMFADAWHQVAAYCGF